MQPMEGGGKCSHGRGQGGSAYGDMVRRMVKIE